MKESTRKVKKHDLGIDKKFVLECECYVCGESELYIGDNKKDILKEVKEDGWLVLRSEYFGAVGLWCGCDYIETDTE